MACLLLWCGAHAQWHYCFLLVYLSLNFLDRHWTVLTVRILMRLSHLQFPIEIYLHLHWSFLFWTFLDTDYVYALISILCLKCFVPDLMNMQLYEQKERWYVVHLGFLGDRKSINCWIKSCPVFAAWIVIRNIQFFKGTRWICFLLLALPLLWFVSEDN